MSATGSNIDAVLALHPRKARLRATALAQAEAIQLLNPLNAWAMERGPLVEERVRVWIAIPARNIVEAGMRLAFLGYTERVDALIPVEASNIVFPNSVSVKWNRQLYKRIDLVREDPALLQESAPDKRLFLFESADGQVRPIKGYRGSAGPLEKRGLSMPDARVLVNLVFKPGRGTLLDPFAGAGSIALAARTTGWTVTTADIDPRLRHGLHQISGAHAVADARRLPFASFSFDAIATEPPFHSNQGEMVTKALEEMTRLLRLQSRLAVLAPDWQVKLLARQATSLPLRQVLREPVDRRGNEMWVLVLERV